MNKTELVQSIADTAEISKTKAADALDAVIAAITKSLKKGEAVNLIGFGSFQVRSRPARTGRNPMTGDTIALAASNNPVFKAGKALKEAV